MRDFCDMAFDAFEKVLESVWSWILNIIANEFFGELHRAFELCLQFMAVGLFELPKVFFRGLDLVFESSSKMKLVIISLVK